MSHHPNKPDPNKASWEERQAKQAEQRRAYGNRGTENHGAEFTSTGEAHNVELGPALTGHACPRCNRGFERTEPGQPIRARIRDGELICIDEVECAKRSRAAKAAG